LSKAKPILAIATGDGFRKGSTHPTSYLTLHDGSWAWKSLDWDALGRLHDKGMIDNPASKRKSVAFTDEGLQRAKALFEEMFEK
jgi:hypothetical protein